MTKLTDEELLACALAQAAATLDLADQDQQRLQELLFEQGQRCGIDAQAGEEYQRVVLQQLTK